MKKQNLGNFLKIRTRSYSAQAAVTSLVIHLLLIIFAGSIVAVRYVRKQNAELIASTESRPKLERKKLQAAARVEQLQKRALTSKLVSKKVSFSNPEFVLPDTGRIGSLKTQKTSLPGADAGRILKNLSRVSGIGPARINFFGIRAESEKVVFIIDASSAMLEDRTGGFATYEYIKTELSKIISEMKPAMLFNLLFYDQQRVFMFSPNLIPASRETAGALAEWIQTVNRSPAETGLLPDQNNYSGPVPYETAVGNDAQGWLLALQAAMEQQPDTVMMLGTGWGNHHINSEKSALLLDFATWELVAGSVISDAPALASDRKLRDDLIKEAVTTIQKEEKIRMAKKLPAEFVRDISQYVEYSRDQVLGHLETVYKTSYSTSGLSKPDIHCVCLAEGDSQIVAGGTIQHLRTLTANYNGKLDFLRRETWVGSASGQTADSSVTAERGGSPVSFFGVQGSGSRIAFILDASQNMLTDENGGPGCYSFVKEQIRKGAAGIQNDRQFNVILHNGRQLALFQPQMVPASPENIEALREWLQPVNSDSLQPGIPDGIATVTPMRDYKTSIGSDSSGWLLALQAAIEQQADAVFIAGSGWGYHPVSREKGRKLLDFSVWESWGGGSAGSSGGAGGSAGGASVVEEVGEDGETISTAVATVSSAAAAASGGASLGTITGLQQDKQQRDALLKEALKAIGQEDKLRKTKGLPQPFVRDILSYLYYTAPQVGEHLTAVLQAEYTDGNLTKPAINFICIVPAESGPAGGEAIRNLRKLTADYAGNLVLFRGAASFEEMKKLNRNLDLTEW
jgi:hypothetical protein